MPTTAMSQDFKPMGWARMVLSHSSITMGIPRALSFPVILCLISVFVSCAYPGKKEVHVATPPGEAEQRLRAALKEWEGTPYRWGSADHRGIDCSGLVMRLYGDVFKMQLPRTTKEQMGFGRPIPRTGLKAGDLVFFSLKKKIYHVGICLNNGEFAHASTSLGVTISSLNDPYWEKAFVTARRVHPLN